MGLDRFSILKFNENHDSDGKFATSDGSGGATGDAADKDAIIPKGVDTSALKGFYKEAESGHETYSGSFRTQDQVAGLVKSLEKNGYTVIPHSVQKVPGAADSFTMTGPDGRWVNVQTTANAAHALGDHAIEFNRSNTKDGYPGVTNDFEKDAKSNEDFLAKWAKHIDAPQEAEKKEVEKRGVTKFNGNHGTDGKFAQAGGDAGVLRRVAPTYFKDNPVHGNPGVKGAYKAYEHYENYKAGLRANGFQREYRDPKTENMQGILWKHPSGSTIIDKPMAAHQSQITWHGPKGATMKANLAHVLKRDFTTMQREADAKEGVAMPDGSFPIANVHDLHNAIDLVGRATDPSAAKAHIIGRAKALGAHGSLPQAWTAKKGDPGYVDVGSAPTNVASGIDYSKVLDARPYFSGAPLNTTTEMSASLSDMAAQVLSRLPVDERERFQGQIEKYRTIDEVPASLMAVMTAW